MFDIIGTRRYDVLPTSAAAAARTVLYQFVNVATLVLSPPVKIVNFA